MPTLSSPVPQRNLSVDTIIGVLERTAFNPSILLPLVLAARFTKKGETWSILHSTTFKRLKLLLYLSILKIVTQWYSKKALNNWAVDKRWNWCCEVAVVTGGAGGIGGHITQLLAGKGVRVAVLDIQDMTYDGGPNIAYFKCDITSSTQIAETAAKIRAKWGDITILVNNAGVVRGKTILEMTEKDVRFTFDVNSISHYLLAKEFLPAMVKRDHGMVVTIASLAAFITVPNMVDYASTKAAATCFHEGLSAELKMRYNAPRVRTILVNQGYTNTSLFTGYQNEDQFLMPTLEPEVVAQAIVDQILKGESGQIIMPKFAGIILPALRALPHFYQHSIRMKGKALMSKWTGRQVVEDLDAFYKNEKPAVEESGILVPKEAVQNCAEKPRVEQLSGENADTSAENAEKNC